MSFSRLDKTDRARVGYVKKANGKSKGKGEKRESRGKNRKST